MQMTTASEEKEREEELPSDPETKTLRRQARTRASSVTPSSFVSLNLLTDSAQVFRRAYASAAGFLDREGSLVHAQPPTFRQARDRHHECAGHFQAGLLRWPRFVWGYLHLLVIMPALYLAVWVTESPARFLVTALIIAAICYWS